MLYRFSVVIFAARMCSPHGVPAEVWDAVGRSLDKLEQPQRCKDGDWGAHVLLCSRRQFMIIANHLAGNPEKGTSVIALLRDVTQVAESAALIGHRLPGQNVSVSSNFKVHWWHAVEPVHVPATELLISLSTTAMLRSATGYQFLECDYTSDEYRNIVIRADTVWKLLSGITKQEPGYCFYSILVMRPDVQTEFTAWPTLGQLYRSGHGVNVFARVRPQGDGRWHVVRQGDNPLYGDKLVLDLDEGARIGGVVSTGDKYFSQFFTINEAGMLGRPAMRMGSYVAARAMTPEAPGIVCSVSTGLAVGRGAFYFGDAIGDGAFKVTPVSYGTVNTGSEVRLSLRITSLQDVALVFPGNVLFVNTVTVPVGAGFVVTSPCDDFNICLRAVLPIPNGLFWVVETSFGLLDEYTRSCLIKSKLLELVVGDSARVVKL